MHKIVGIIFVAMISFTCPAQDKVLVSTPGFGFITADVDAYEVVRYSKEGKRLWVYDKVRAIDSWLLKNDQVLIAYLPSKKTANKGGVRIVDSEKKTLMDHQIEDEVMSCLILPNGNILFTECKAGKLTEMDRTGKVIRSFDVKSKGMGHKTVRFIRMTPEKTILAAECYSHLLREYTLEGKFIRAFKLKMAYCGYRLNNGNTLISGYKPPRVIEVDKDGKTVWEISSADLPKSMGLANFCEAHRLENGNTVISNCIRRSGKDKTVLFEVTPEKKLVWQLKDSMRIKGLTAVKPLKGE